MPDRNQRTPESTEGDADATEPVAEGDIQLQYYLDSCSAQILEQ
jgi:hypothetical protein